jgi:hypothetical protein
VPAMGATQNSQSCDLGELGGEHGAAAAAEDQPQRAEELGHGLAGQSADRSGIPGPIVRALFPAGEHLLHGIGNYP